MKKKSKVQLAYQKETTFGVTPPRHPITSKVNKIAGQISANFITPCCQKATYLAVVMYCDKDDLPRPFSFHGIPCQGCEKTYSVEIRNDT